MQDRELNLCKEDISIELVEAQLCQSGLDNCTELVTHRVMIDFRQAGQQALLGEFCETCATEIAKRIQDGLPTYKEIEEPPCTTQS